MKALGWIGWFVVAVFVSSLLEAWSLHRLWMWFCAAQYGDGPTMGTWFGIACIKSVLFQSLQKEGTSVDGLGAFVKQCLKVWLFVLSGIGLAWCIGTVMGWAS